MEQKCRVCGCTQNDCRQCIEKTGSPCYWVEDDLCSACVEETGAVQSSTLPAGSNQTGNEVERVEEKTNTGSSTPDPYQEHVNKVLSQPKFVETKFFEQLHLAGQGADLTIRLKEKNGVYTVMVLPEVANKAAIKPIVLTGTPQEIDAGFFHQVGHTLRESCLKVMGLEEHKKSVDALASKKDEKQPDKKEDSSSKKSSTPPSKKPAAKKGPAKKPASKQPEKKTPVEVPIPKVEETPLF